MKAKPKKDRVYQSLPNGLRRNVSYDGRLMTNKDFIDTLILKDGYIFLKKHDLKSGAIYILENGVGRKFRFKNKSEKEYIDKLMDKILEGAKVEMEHKGTIEAIKKPGINTKDAAAMIAADHIAEKIDYYNELDKAKLEEGGHLSPSGVGGQDLSKGTTLQGPSHKDGGIDIHVNGTPVANAQGGEIVINKKSSKLFCEELSEINQKGGGKALDCSTCDKKDTCTHKMEQGGKMPVPNALSQMDDFAEDGDILADGGKLNDSTKTQSILFDKNIYSLEYAKDWLYKHNYSNSTQVDETENNYRFRQQNPDNFDENSFRTITLTNGIKAVIGKEKLQTGGEINEGDDYFDENIHEPLEIDYFENGGEIEKRVSEAIRKAEGSKEFKDTDIVNYTKKYAAQYNLITLSDLYKIEQDAVTAYKLIEKSKIWQAYSAENLKQEGNSSGAAYLKVKAREALSARPLDSKDAREQYVKHIERLIFELAQQKTLIGTKDVLTNFANVEQMDLGQIPEKLKSHTYNKKTNYFIEIFGKKFYNYCRFISDSAKTIYVEANLYDAFTPEMRNAAIRMREDAIKSKISAAENILQEIKEIQDREAIREIVSKYDKSYWYGFEKEEVVGYYQKTLKSAQEALPKIEESLPKSFAVREESWDWADTSKKKEPKAQEEKEPKATISILEEYGISDWRKDAKRLPLDFIKRTGGISVEKISVGEVTEKFGYRNVIFGNYVNDLERKESLKHFLGAMLDLHETMNMDVSGINKLGGLDINFGSTGCGSFSLAMACYMPQLKAINLTKKRGDGCIAHEWSHYLDNILGEGSERKATKQTYASLLQAFYKNNEKIKFAFYEFINWLNNGGQERTINVKFAPAKKYRFTLYGANVDESIKGIQARRDYYAQYKNAQDLSVLRYYGYMAYAQNENKPISVPMKTKQCMYMYQSSLYGGSDYWTNPKELFARAFEWYVEDALERQNRTNTYLVSTKNSMGIMYHLIPFDKHPYPRAEEDKAFLRNWFPKLFSIIREQFEISPFKWTETERVSEYLDYTEQQKKDLIDTGIKVSDSGKIVSVGDDIEKAEGGYAFKRDLIKGKQVYTALLNMDSINVYISKLKEDKWTVYSKDSEGENYIFETFNTLEQAKEYILKNKMEKQTISEMDKIVAAIPPKEFEQMKINTYGHPLEPIGENKYHLLMDYYANNRIDFSKIPVSLQEEIGELAYESKWMAEEIADDSSLSEKEKEEAQELVSVYPHKLILKYPDVPYENPKETVIAKGIQLFDVISEKYPTAITTAQEQAANYSLFDDFHDENDKNDFRNITFNEFVEKNIAADPKIKIAYMILRNPENYTQEEKMDASNINNQLLLKYQSVIRAAIKELYYDKRISECQLSFNKAKEIILSADIPLPAHYKLLAETSCRSKRQMQLAKSAQKAEQTKKMIALKKEQEEKLAKEKRELKQKAKQATKSLKESESQKAEQQRQEEDRNKKLKIAKAKAAAQKQRIRIILMATPENLVNKLKFRFSKTIEDFGITEIFVRDGEVNITSNYDVLLDHVEAIEKYIKNEMK